MKVYVGNLPDGATEAAIRTAFEKHGRVSSVMISRDRASREWRAVVEMPDEAKARIAIDALNGRDFEGRNLNVTEQIPGENFG